MSALKRYIKEFFTFAKWEQRGIVLLSGALVLIAIFILFYNPKQEVFVAPAISKYIQDFEKQVLLSKKKASFNSDINWNEPLGRKKDAITLFKFDPNTATLEDFRILGFSLKQAQVLLNYRAKGGRFRTPEDFGRSFVVSEEHYKLLAAYIVINRIGGDSVKRFIPNSSMAHQLVDINTADSVKLKMLRGIGPAIAKRIIDYRNRLGGFTRNEQLLEIYGIDSSRYLLLSNQLEKPSKWNRIRINFAEVEELKRHPYLSSYEARNIVYFRIKKGPIRSLQQLVENRIISKSTAEKLSEYIDYSN